MGRLLLAIDQGTTSTRCLVFDAAARVAGQAQAEHRQIYPQPGWVEHDPREIWEATQQVVRGALRAAGAAGADIAGLGIANQRETVVVWDPRTGRPYANAIVWQDTRTDDLCRRLAQDGGQDRFRGLTGLPLATYFTGPKIAWLLDNLPGLRQAAEAGQAVAGTLDAWLIWNLTGGPRGGVLVTDLTNASRTLLLGLDRLEWEPQLLSALRVPRALLPRLVPSSDPRGYGLTRPDGPLEAAVPVCAALGDQQAALLGQGCFEPGDVKNTYGTGCFMLLNTGRRPIASRHGLLTTVAWKLADQPPAYALEGSVAIAGALVQWLRDNLGLLAASSDIEALARQVPDSAGVYIVPAFSGLFAPHWRSDARGVIAGLTRYATKAHLARAALEATAYQTRDVLDAMRADAGMELRQLKVDGGMVVNELLMQFQADILGLPVIRAALRETTALGAAFAAGLAVGVFPSLAALRERWRADRTWTPALAEPQRQRLHAGWKKAVARSLDWVA